MIKLKQPIILKGDYTLGELNTYAQRGYDFSFRSDTELQAFFLKLVQTPEDISLEELKVDLKSLGVYEASVFVDGKPLHLSRVAWATDWRMKE